MKLLLPLTILLVVVAMSTAFPELSRFEPVEGDVLPDQKDKIPDEIKPQVGRAGKTIIFAGGYPGMYGGYGGYPGYYGGYGMGYGGYGYYG